MMPDSGEDRFDVGAMDNFRTNEAFLLLRRPMRPFDDTSQRRFGQRIISRPRQSTLL